MVKAKIFRNGRRQESGSPIRIVIADGHALFREGLQKLFESCSNIAVIGRAAYGSQAIRLVCELKPDILLLDHRISKPDGIQVLHRIRRFSQTRTIVLTAQISGEENNAALQLGASAILMKTSSFSEVLNCIVSVQAGEPWSHCEVVEPKDPPSPQIPHPDSPAKSFGPRITNREMDVISAVVAGYSNKGIAVKLSISEQTVKHHLSNIFDKIGISNRLELALYAHHNGLNIPTPRQFEAVLSATGVPADFGRSDSVT
jgi:DNA-binding NarL/FixJ family response regulator